MGHMLSVNCAIFYCFFFFLHFNFSDSVSISSNVCGRLFTDVFMSTGTWHICVDFWLPNGNSFFFFLHFNFSDSVCNHPMYVVGCLLMCLCLLVYGIYYFMLTSDYLMVIHFFFFFFFAFQFLWFCLHIIQCMWWAVYWCVYVYWYMAYITSCWLLTT